MANQPTPQTTVHPGATCQHQVRSGRRAATTPTAGRCQVNASHRTRKPDSPASPAPPGPRATAPAPRGGPEKPQPGRSKTDRAIDAAINALIADAPPLSEQTRARLTELFSVTGREAARRTPGEGLNTT